MTEQNGFPSFKNNSSKVLADDAILANNTSTREILGPKFNNFAKNLTQLFSKNDNSKPIDLKHNELKNNNTTYSTNEVNILTKISNHSANGKNASSKCNGNVSLSSQNSTLERYPKPGQYGNMQVFQMTGINTEINQPVDRSFEEKGNNHYTYNGKEIGKLEQEKLDEILKMCTDYERQNSNVQSSPIVQNRIKTNGSLPRDRKPSFTDLDSPQHSADSQSQSRTFFPINTGYENVKLSPDGYVEISPRSSTDRSPSHEFPINQSRYQNVPPVQNSSPQSPGYENVFCVRRLTPQSPRSKIKIRTCATSPSKEMAIHQLEYEKLTQSFEEKLQHEIQSLRQNRCHNNYDDSTKYGTGPVTEMLDKFMPLNDNCVKNFKNLKLSIPAEPLNEIDTDELVIERGCVLNKIRSLKTEIAELQRQEEEVLRELDMEKALVTAELTTEETLLLELQRHLNALQTRIHRLEAQRNANRVMQETQQSKLKQNIDVKQSEIHGLKKLLLTNSNDNNLQDELGKGLEILDNDKKIFEDMEFQYLEEETEWLAYREELHNELKTLTTQINEKRLQIVHLQSQSIENQDIACSDTKGIEKILWTLLNDLEKSRERLKSIDKILSLSASSKTPDIDESYLAADKRRPINDTMSQSLIGSQEMLSSTNQIKNRTDDIMSKSVNENYFTSNVEMPTKLSLTHPMQNSNKKEAVPTTKPDNDVNYLVSKQNDDKLSKLKYNLSPPFKHKIQSPTDVVVNLNLSIESDDFEGNPLEKRIPSQDDIDRICKITLDAPISTEGANIKVYQSIKEIERNRQLLLAQQGSQVLEHERQKMTELKRKIHDEAKAEYLQLQDTELKNVQSIENLRQSSPPIKGPSELNEMKDSNKNELTELPINSKRQSHSDIERQRPVSDTNNYEPGHEVIGDKLFKSTNDVRISTASSQPLNEMSTYDENTSQGSILSSQSELNDMPKINRRSGSATDTGKKRNLPKHQRPLTRYLPIMSIDLDLRQHIESAGHQVTLCPHVVIDSYSCRGYLHKLGATFHGWSRRWFVFDRQKMALMYYSDKSERKIRGGAYFSTIDEVYLDHLNASKSGRPHCTFIVKTKKRCYHLQAASDSASRIWIDVIITGAQGNIEY